MDIFMILKLLGGLALFLYGMKLMGDGLQALASGKMAQILERLTGKTIYGVLLGAGVTAVIQSSSATTVMVISFVNSGIMSLRQAVGVIMGANIGTTITSWLLSMVGIQSDAVFIKLLKPSSFAPILAMIGVVLYMKAKENTKRINISHLLIGFSVLIFGMDAMSASMEPLTHSPYFENMLVAHGVYCHHPKLISIGWNPAGTVFDGNSQLWCSTSYHPRSEYRHMFHRIAIISGS